MMKIVLHTFTGCLSVLLYGINTIVWTFPIVAIAFFKFVIPITMVANICRSSMNFFASKWIFFNNLNQRIFSNIRWDVKGIEQLNMNSWYMVIANHQSWVDIFVLQNIFYKKIPFLKFFIKRELFWVPVIGQVWWALEFPFVRRYSREKLAKFPHLIGKDLETTRLGCDKLGKVPTSIMNFVEGSRFTPKKHIKQKSNYKNLLRAKAGGLSFVIGTMSNKLRQIVDVTIAYPNGKKSFWDFLCGKTGEIKVRVKVRNVTKDMLGNLDLPRFSGPFF